MIKPFVMTAHTSRRTTFPPPPIEKNTKLKRKQLKKCIKILYIKYHQQTSWILNKNIYALQKRTVKTENNGTKNNNGNRNRIILLVSIISIIN